VLTACFDDLVDAIRAWAKGWLPTGAAAELLIHGWEAGADVNELADARPGGRDGVAKKTPVAPGGSRDLGYPADHPHRRLPVGLEIVFTVRLLFTLG